MQGRVRDLALAGAGIAAEGLQAGDQLQLTLTDGDGVPVVSDLEASVVHVAAGVAGIAFAAAVRRRPGDGSAGGYGSSRLSSVQPL